MHHNTPFNPGLSHPRKMTVQLIQRARVGTRDRLGAARMDLPDAAGLGALSRFMRSLRRCRWAFLRPQRLSSSLASSAVSLKLTRPLFMNSAQGIGPIIFVMKSANWRYVGTQRITTTLFSTKSLQMRRSRTLCRSCWKLSSGDNVIIQGLGIRGQMNWNVGPVPPLSCHLLIPCHKDV